MFARLTWIVGIWKARSLVAVVTLDMSLDEQHWRLCWFHTNYLFSTICFRHDWLHLKVDISSFLCIYFSCLLRQVFVEIQLVLLCLWRDLTKRTIIFALFYKITLFFNPLQFKWYLILICTIKNVVFLVIFSHHKKTRLVRSSTPEVYIAQAVAARQKIDSVWKWWPHCFRHTAPRNTLPDLNH